MSSNSNAPNRSSFSEKVTTPKNKPKASELSSLSQERKSQSSISTQNTIVEKEHKFNPFNSSFASDTYETHETQSGFRKNTTNEQLGNNGKSENLHKFEKVEVNVSHPPITHNELQSTYPSAISSDTKSVLPSLNLPSQTQSSTLSNSGNEHLNTHHHSRSASMASSTSNTPRTHDFPPAAQNIFNLRRLSYQAERNAQVQKEAELLQKQEEFAEKFWHLQEQRFANLLTRAVAAERTAKEVWRYLNHENKVIQNLLKEESISFGSVELGSVSKASVSHDETRKTSERFLNELANRVYSVNLSQMRSLTKQLYKNVETIQTKGSTELKNVKSQRIKVNEAWLKYQLSLQQRQLSDDSELKTVNDPYLACQSYMIETSALAEIEKHYSSTMSELYAQMLQTDEMRINAIKLTLLTVLQAKQAALSAVLQSVNASIASCQSIEAKSDIDTFVQLAQLKPTTEELSAANVSPVNSVFELPPPSLAAQSAIKQLSELEVEKEGPLQRQGNIMKSHWKICYVVLTRSSFLHVFENEEKKNLKYSLPLIECIVEMKEGSVFEIQKQNNSFFSSNPVIYEYKAETRTESEKWTQSIKKFLIANL